MKKKISKKNNRKTRRNKKRALKGGSKNTGKKILIIDPHFALGDCIVISPAAHFLSDTYDEVHTVSALKWKSNIEALYKNNPKVKAIYLNTADELPLQKYIDDGYEIRKCISNGWGDNVLWPNEFYNDLKIPTSARRTHFQIDKTESAKKLYDKIKHRPYIIVHEEASSSPLAIVNFLKSNGETRLILDLNKNQVDPKTDPEGHELAKLVIFQPIADYVDLMENAEELHLIDSAMLCLAMHLNLEKVKKRVLYTRTEHKNVKERVVDHFGLFEDGAI